MRITAAPLLLAALLASSAVSARDASDYSTQELVEALAQRLSKVLLAGPTRDAPPSTAAIVMLEGKGLRLRFAKTAQLTGRLEHWQHDTFIVRWDDRSLNADAFVNFSLDPDGKVREVRMQSISDLTDFSFDFQDLLFTPVTP